MTKEAALYLAVKGHVSTVHHMQVWGGIIKHCLGALGWY